METLPKQIDEMTDFMCFDEMTDFMKGAISLERVLYLLNIDESIISTATKGDIQRDGAEIINTFALPSREKLQAFLFEEYAPAAREHKRVRTYDQGLSYYEACQKYYNLKSATGEPLTADGKKEEIIKDLIEEKVMGI